MTNIFRPAHKCAIIRPSNSYKMAYSLYFVFPGISPELWCKKDSIEECFDFCREKGYKILYVSDCIYGLSFQNLFSPPLDLAWLPSLSRQDVKKAFSSHSEYLKLVTGGKSIIINSTEELRDYAGFLFGGEKIFAEIIQRRIDSNQSLIFDQNGFQVSFSDEMARSDVAMVFEGE